MTFDELDQEDEGWIWLPWEELQAVQRQKNTAMRMLIDNAAIATGPRVLLNGSPAAPSE